MTFADSILLEALDILEDLGRSYPELDVPVDHLIKEQPIVESYIKKKPGTNQYCVYSEKGKHMGCYPSREKAKKRLRQIEFFKHKGEMDTTLMLTAAYIERRKNFYNVKDDAGNYLASYPTREKAMNHKHELERNLWFKHTQDWMKEKRQKRKAEVEDDLDNLIDMLEDTEVKIKEALTPFQRGAEFEELPKFEDRPAPAPYDVGLKPPKKYPPNYKFKGDIKPKQQKGPGMDVIEKYNLPGTDYTDTAGYANSGKVSDMIWTGFDNKMPSGLPDAPGEYYTSTSIKPNGWLQRSAQDPEKSTTSSESIIRDAVDTFVPLVGGRGYLVFWRELNEWVKNNYPDATPENIEAVKQELLSRGLLFDSDISPEDEAVIKAQYANVMTVLQQLDDAINKISGELEGFKDTAADLRYVIKQYAYDWTDEPVRYWLAETALPTTMREHAVGNLTALIPKYAIITKELKKLKSLLQEAKGLREELGEAYPIPIEKMKMYHPELRGASLRTAGLSTKQVVELIEESRTFLRTFDKEIDAIAAAIKETQKEFQTSVKNFDYIGFLEKRKETKPKTSARQAAEGDEHEQWMNFIYQQIEEKEQRREELEKLEEMTDTLVEQRTEEYASQGVDETEAKKLAEEQTKEDVETAQAEVEQLNDDIKELEQEQKEITKEDKKGELPSGIGVAELEEQKKDVLKKYPWIADYIFIDNLLLFDSDKFPKDYQEVRNRISEIEALLKTEPDPSETALLEKQLTSLQQDYDGLTDKYIQSFYRDIEPLKQRFDTIVQSASIKTAAIKEFDTYIKVAKDKGVSVVSANWILEILGDYPGFKENIDTTRRLVNEALQTFDAAGLTIVNRPYLDTMAEGLRQV